MLKSTPTRIAAVLAIAASHAAAQTAPDPPLKPNPSPTPRPTAVARTPRDVAEKVMPSVVLLIMEDGHGQHSALGSGFVVGEGIIATNHHVIDGAARGYARLVGQSDKLPIRGVVGVDEHADLALLSVENLRAPALRIGDSSAMKIGDDVFVVGNPEGLEGTFSSGIVSGIRRVDNEHLIQITAPISSGSSGGSVLNKNGEVIGVAIGMLKDGQNLNFAIPASYLSMLLAKEQKLRPIGKDARIDWNVLPPAVDDSEVSIDELRKAAEEGDSDAMYKLGEKYSAGKGLLENDFEAVRWFRKAAEKGNPRAMILLGGMYAQGHGVTRDDREAEIWFRKAAETGDGVAMAFLGFLHECGGCVPQDDGEAVNWYRKAAEKGEASGMIGLAEMYAHGRGVPQDDREAANWYRKAAEKGLSGAMAKLGMMHSSGRGVPQDDREAVIWLRKAAEKGHGMAMAMLGASYALGRGVPKDDAEAYVWFSLAAAFGMKEAEERRDAVERLLTPEARLAAQERSRELFEQISQHTSK